jgi:hypothetical protein
MGVSDVLPVSRIGTGRSLRRAIAASVIATITKEFPEKVPRRTWGRDEAALTILRAAQAPTGTTDYPTYDAIGPFRSLSPASRWVCGFCGSGRTSVCGAV